MPNTATHVADTPLNDGPNVSLNCTNDHSPEEEGRGMIVEDSQDDVEGSINDKWVNVIEETSVVFDGDDTAS